MKKKKYFELANFKIEKDNEGKKSNLTEKMQLLEV